MPKKIDALAAQKKRTNPVRPYNERLFLDLIRDEIQMSKAELTRASGLSAQSATVIVNRLVKEGLLKAGKSVKGKIGQPSTPYSLHPDGALSIGIKVGRRSLEIASMSFDYQIIQSIVQRYDFPHLETIRQDIPNCVAKLFADMSDKQRRSIIGIGIALPDNLEAWETTAGAPKGAMADWADADLAADLAEKFDLPVRSLNDATAACLAEIAVGNSLRNQCFAYFYVGTFIGGGIAIGGQLYRGQRNLAGAIASMPTSAVSSGVARQLLEGASLHYLEQSAKAAGLDPNQYYDSETIDQPLRDVFETWLATAAPQIAFASVSAQAFLDPDAIVIDSSLSADLTAELVKAVRKAIFSLFDHRGLANIDVVCGENGASARAIGSSIEPFLSEFALERV